MVKTTVYNNTAIAIHHLKLKFLLIFINHSLAVRNLLITKICQKSHASQISETSDW